MEFEYLDFDAVEYTHETRCNDGLYVERTNLDEGYAQALPIDFQDDDDYRYLNIEGACRTKV